MQISFVLCKRAQAPAQTTLISKLISPPKNMRKRTTAQTGRWMSRRKAKRGPHRGLLRELKIPRFLTPFRDPFNSFSFFFFLHSDNNTGQIKSASQTTVTLSFINNPSLIYIFLINHKELLIFTERPLSCTCSFFFFLDVKVTHVIKRKK